SRQVKTTGTMKAKRSKKYRKLMHQYGVSFGFREPYQVLRMYPSRPFKSSQMRSLGHIRLIDIVYLVDSHFLRTVYSFKMDLMPALERTLQGKVKPCMFLSLTYILSFSIQS